MCCGGMSGRSLATVCCSMVSLPTIFSNCLGVRVRLRGQKRVPRPPAKITACVVSLSAAISVPSYVPCLIEDCAARGRDLRSILQFLAQPGDVRDITPKQRCLLLPAAVLFREGPSA